MKKKIPVAIFSLIMSISLNAQITEISIEGIKFSDYPAITISQTKAKLNLTSHPIGRSYKTTISRQYESEPINFGGHYVIIFWGAGMGVTDGVMVDALTGKIIPIPLSEDNSLRDCFYNNNENIFYKKHSNLFVTFKCERIGKYDEDNDAQKILLTYYYYKWNGKRFDFLFSSFREAVED